MSQLTIRNLPPEIEKAIRRRARERHIPTNDIWIAAATLEHGAVLLSRDAHFDRVPLLERLEGESA